MLLLATGCAPADPRPQQPGGHGGSTGGGISSGGASGGLDLGGKSGASTGGGAGAGNAGGNFSTGGAGAGAGVGAGAGAGGAGIEGGSGGSIAGGGLGAAGGTIAGGAGGSGGAVDPGKGYYVAPTGSDDNPGTSSAPFLTIGKARDAVRTANDDMMEDIHVYLRAGTYRFTETLVLEPGDSATNGHRVHYQAYPGETPILSGSIQVTGWTPHTGGIYRAALERTTKLRNLYVNDARADLSSKTVPSRGGYGTYSVTAGQADWAWMSGSNSDGAKYDMSAVPAITSNKDDLEIVNGTTWNENIVCVRDVITTTDNYRGLLFQQPYGAIAQLPGWNAGFSVSGTHTLYNALEFLTAPGQFYFDKTEGTLYYYPRPGEDMSTAEVEAPVVETLITIAGASNTERVEGITFDGLTLENTDYLLHAVGASRGKASVQGATVYVAYGNGDWHQSKYEITDTFPAMVSVQNAASIHFMNNVFEHGGSEGLSLVNDVVDSEVVGNSFKDMAGSGITVGHPQHIYIGDGGTHAKFPPGIEGICRDNAITNNVILDVSTQPGFGGHAAITAFFVEGLAITHNHVQTTAYNGINLGWGWRNFKDSTTSKNNSVSNNRLIDTLNRLHDSGAIYTIGQNPGTTINQNYVLGIPPATSGPTYGLHNDEGSAYITENDNVLDISPDVKYTINCEDFGEKHDLTILRTYATVNRMGVNPPASTIDPPVAVPDNVWPAAPCKVAVNSGVEDAYRSLLPSGLLAEADYVLPVSCSVGAAAEGGLTIRRASDASHVVWLAPAGTTTFAEGPTMTRAAGDAIAIDLPATGGTYKLYLLNSAGVKLGESKAQVRVN